MKTTTVKVCPNCKSIHINYGKKNISYGPGSQAWTPDKRIYECRDCGQRTSASGIANEDHEVPDDVTLCPECNGYKWEFSNSRIGDVTLIRCSHCATTMMPSERKSID